ncbi:MAG TPA: hypothetical protein VLG50_07720 [Candidatus Saccharimonadales bacterium]|nr:hypothetical protein [Candidatus Saccharimonadales bacterium]
MSGVLDQYQHFWYNLLLRNPELQKYQIPTCEFYKNNQYQHYHHDNVDIDCFYHHDIHKQWLHQYACQKFTFKADKKELQIHVYLQHYVIQNIVLTDMIFCDDEQKLKVYDRGNMLNGQFYQLMLQHLQHFKAIT